MNTHPVIFVAFEEFDNLGVGYLMSALSEAGYESLSIDFRDGKKEILRILKKEKPLVVGFSVIFEYHIYEFAELLEYLRKGGIKSHFTAGGQYASLRYNDLFGIIPSLDSVVRFEGEYTILDLADKIYAGTDWKGIPGIAYKTSDKITANPLRPVETDLDKFPFPMRSPLKEYAFDKKFGTILAGRGCLNNCRFCYLREYYNESSGPIKRIRKPEAVVREMELLHLEMGCSVYLFQDDDFPVKPDKSSEWIESFCKTLKRKKLSDKLMWKINCRPDEVDYDSFAMMKRHGLFLVFLGIEDGTDIGLKRLNKHMTVAKCLDGINILKKLKIEFDYGFMLFQPSSTFRSVNDNLDFLRSLCSDGYSPVSFLKMMPYSNTDVEKQLKMDGRLKGNPGFLDYDFLDESMNQYYSFITDCFMEWLIDPDGLLNLSKWSRNYFCVYNQYFDITDDGRKVLSNVKFLISESNLFLLDTMKDLAIIFETEQHLNDKTQLLENYRKKIKSNHQYFRKKILFIMAELASLVKTQQFCRYI